MLSLPLPVRIFLCLHPADMRKSFDGLAQEKLVSVHFLLAIGLGRRYPAVMCTLPAPGKPFQEEIKEDAVLF